MSIKKNYLYSVVYQIFNIIIPLITAPYISRVLGAEGIGIVSYIHSIALYFGMFGMLGLNNYGNRTIAANRKDKKKVSKIFWNIYTLQVMTTSIMLLAYIVFISAFLKENKIVAYVQIVYLLSVVLDINWFFFGMEQFKLTVSRSILIKIISFFMILIFVNNESDVWIYALITTVSMLLSQLLIWPFLIGKIHFVMPSKKEIFPHIIPNIILFIPVITISLYKVMDKVMLGTLGDMVQVGLYENSLKIINIPMGVIMALGNVMLPRMSSMYANGEVDKSKIIIRKSMQFSMFLAFGMAFGLGGIADNFAPVFFGKEFQKTGMLIQLLSITVVFISWANVFRTQYLIPNNKEKIYIKSVAIGALSNIIINMILIPQYGAVGASIGTIFAEALVTLSQSMMISNEFKFKVYIKDSFPFFLSGLLMFLIVKIIGSFDGSAVYVLIVQILIGALIYIANCTIILSKMRKIKVNDLIENLKNNY
jgi:O-antigen/teichoic acid export membrane protein